MGCTLAGIVLALGTDGVGSEIGCVIVDSEVI